MSGYNSETSDDSSEMDVDEILDAMSIDSSFLEGQVTDYSSTSSENGSNSSSSPGFINDESSSSEGIDDTRDDTSNSPTSSESSNEIAAPPESIPTSAENQQPTGSGMNQQYSGSGENQQPTGNRKKKIPTGSGENPIAKKSKIDGEEKSQEEPFSCPICLESLTNTGIHKPACLKCGHIFGEGCLQRWIKVGCNRDARRCPTCNTKASLKDIRILYAKKLVAVDTAELTALEKKLEQENREKNVIKLDLDKWKYKAKQLNNEVERLKTMVEKVRSDQATGSGQLAPIRCCIKKINLGKNPGCRVMAYNKNNLLLVVSQHSESPLFNSHVIRKLNATLLEPTKECIHAHKKQIRDMTFHPTEHNLLASVSLDKCISLTDLTSNVVVSSIEVDEPLWSCCWTGNNSNILIAGGQMGSIYFIDRRFMKVLNSETQRKPACVSLVPLPPSNTRSFINGGFVKTRMDYLSVFEHESGEGSSVYRETELPLRGLWSSCSYDSESNLLLTTSKPCGFNSLIRHVVSKISNFNEEGPLTCPVVVFEGGDKATQLSRTCFVPPSGLNEDLLVSSYDEKSNTIKLFSVNSRKNVHNYIVNEKYLDLCPLTGVITNGRRTLAGLSDNALNIFTV